MVVMQAYTPQFFSCHDINKYYIIVIITILYNHSYILQVYRAEVFYFKVEDPDSYSVSNFPVFVTIHPPVTKVASIYGTPILEYPGLLKVGL